MRLLFLLLTTLWAAACHAQAISVPGETTWSASATRAIFMYEDPTGDMTLDDILALPPGPRGFHNRPGQLADIGLTRSAIWLRLDVANASQQQQLLRLTLGPFNYAVQDSYVQIGSMWEKQESGLERPRPRHRYVSRLPSARIVLPPHELARVYVRLKSEKAFHLRPTLYTANAYQQRESGAQLWDGLLFGGLLAFGWGALMVAFFARSLSFSLLGALCLTVLLHEAAQRGYARYYGWPLAEHLGQAGIQSLGYLPYIIVLLFFLQVAKSERLVLPRRALWALIGLSAVMAVGPYVLGTLAVNQVSLLVTPIRAAALVVVALYLMKQLAPSRKLILAQAVFVFVVMTLRVLDSHGYLADIPALAGIDALGANPVFGLIALFVNLAILAGWIHHIAQQRKIAAAKLLQWQEDEQQRLRNEVARQTEAMQQALQYANDKNREKTEILSYIGHDLRAPLATISGYVKVLHAEPESRVSPPVKAIKRSIDYQMTLIDELLKYARTELRPPVLSSAPVYVKTLMDDLAHHAQALARQQANRLRFRVSPVLPELLLLDGKRLQQVLLNLLANAAKFTHNGDITLHVNALQAPGAWTMRFAVSDTGVGIPEGRKAAIFKAFEQAGADAPGIGLGLFIAQNIVREMGGSLDLQSAPGRGSIFSFQIRLRGLNDNFMSWTPPAPMLPAAPPSPPTAEPAPAASAPANAAGLPSWHRRMQLALMARDGRVTDIEDWLNETAAECPGAQAFLARIKAALYELDLSKVEGMALASSEKADAPASAGSA